jgi:transcription elongation factor Elf1
MSLREHFELHCPACRARLELGPTLMLNKLQQLGMFRRDSEPTPELLLELFRKKIGSFSCDSCGGSGLQIRAANDEWGQVRDCARCGKRIPSERMELFPNADLCAGCQTSADRGGGAEAEYCPRCGSIMMARPVYGRGITRYSLSCSNCRK